MFKYLLEENLIALDDFGIEHGYDHCIIKLPIFNKQSI